ncbi:MAG: transporter [Planctomycetes bacterium]|nr:transporter [Planctomycetota bacterium]
MKRPRRPRWAARSVIAVAAVAGISMHCLAEDEYTRFRYEHSKIITEDPFPVALGCLQAEVEYIFRASKYQWTDGGNRRKRDPRRLQLAALSLTYGVAKHADLEAVLGFASVIDREQTPDEGDGLTDLAVRSNCLLHYNEDAGFAVAYLPMFTFPLGEQRDVDELAISFESYTFDNRIAIVKDWSHYVTTNFDLGYIWFFGKNAGGTNGVIEGNAAIGFQHESWLQPVFEVRYAREFLKSEGDRERVSVLGGLVMPISESTRIEVGLHQAVAGRNTNQFTGVIASLSVTF